MYLPGEHTTRQVKLGGTHRFHDTANQEAKHRVSLKSNGEKIRVRSDTQTEQDLLRVTQEEIVFETVEGFLNDIDEDTPVTLAQEIAEYNRSSRDLKSDQSVRLTSPLLTDKDVCDEERDHLVHKEVLLSWREVLHMFVHCFPDVAPVQEKAKWGVYQHCSHTALDGKNYHYWGTDNGYPAISRGGVRRRRDMVRVSLGGVHLAEIVCFVKALLPSNNPPDEAVQFVGALVRWLTPHEYAVMQNGSPTCPGPLRHSHNLWAWHRTQVQREAISGYRFGRLPQAHKTWLQPSSKRESLLFASYDVIELQSIGKYANVTHDFCTNGFLESVSWT